MSQTPLQHLQQPAEPGARRGCESHMFYCNLGSSPLPLRRKFYIRLNFKPSLQNCQFTSPTSKNTQHPGVPACSRLRRQSVAPGMPGGPVLQQEIFLQPPPPLFPPSPPHRPPTWSCGQFNQPSFPKLSQPARAIVTAGKNRQAPFTHCFMGSSYSLVQANFKAGCCPLIPAKLPWTNNGLKAIQLSLSSTMHFISHSVLSSV